MAPDPRTPVRVIHGAACPFTIPPPPAPWARPVSRPGGAAIAAALGLLLWVGIIGGVMWAAGDAADVVAVRVAGVGR